MTLTYQLVKIDDDDTTIARLYHDVSVERLFISIGISDKRGQDRPYSLHAQQ